MAIGAERETDRTRLKHAHENLDRLETEVSELRRRVAAQDAVPGPSEEESKGAASSGSETVTPRDLVAPLAQLEEAARMVSELEVGTQAKAQDDADAAVVEPESVPREGPPSSLYHVEEFSDDLDFMDDPPDSDDSTDDR